MLYLFDMIKLKECERGSRHQLGFSGDKGEATRGKGLYAKVDSPTLKQAQLE